MAHMQRAGHVGWWQQDAEVVAFTGVKSGREIAAGLPELVPPVFYVLGFKGFVEFAHGARFYHSNLPVRLVWSGFLLFFNVFDLQSCGRYSSRILDFLSGCSSE